MRYLFLLCLLAITVFSVPAQNRQSAMTELESLSRRGEILAAEILKPDNSDVEAAAKENAEVFRILPRNRNDNNLFTVRGGGAYYSFTKKSHSYNEIPQIALDGNNLSVGFYGASYGFVTDLGEISLAEVDRETKSVNFLISYRPPNEEPKARIEQRKANVFEDDGIIYKDRFPAVVNHLYALRAVSYEEADTLVVFKVYRRDFDGSLIIFWKLIENFEKPVLLRNQSSYSADAVNFISPISNLESNLFSADNLVNKARKALREKGFRDVTIDDSTKPVTLCGSVPKGKLAEAILLVQKTIKTPLKNELVEK